MTKAVGKIALAGLAVSVGAVVFAGSASAAPSDDSAPTTTDAAPDYVLHFDNTSFDPVTDDTGTTFVGSGPVTDADGNEVGTVVDTCFTVADPEEDPTVDCSLTLKLADGDIQIDTVDTIELDPAEYPYAFDGIVNGGTDAYEGADGEASFVAVEPGTYNLTLAE